jgi:hypothetical protein
MPAQTSHLIKVDEPQVREILDHIDGQARALGERTENRRSWLRKRLRVSCLIRYASRDDRTIQTTAGKTRDLSRVGLGVLTKVQFPAHTDVHVTLALGDEKTGVLTGKVVYSRGLRSGWYLMGVKLQPIADRRLYPDTAPDESEAASPPREPQAGPVPYE